MVVRVIHITVFISLLCFSFSCKEEFVALESDDSLTSSVRERSGLPIPDPLPMPKLERIQFTGIVGNPAIPEEDIDVVALEGAIDIHATTGIIISKNFDKVYSSAISEDGSLYLGIKAKLNEQFFMTVVSNKPQMFSPSIPVQLNIPRQGMTTLPLIFADPDFPPATLPDDQGMTTIHGIGPSLELLSIVNMNSGKTLQIHIPESKKFSFNLKAKSKDRVRIYIAPKPEDPPLLTSPWDVDVP